MKKNKYIVISQKDARRATAIALSALIVASMISLAGMSIPNLPGRANTAWAGTFPGSNGQIAFVSTRDANNAEIYVMNADGSGQTRLTSDTTPDAEPSWSSDGSKIAFRKGIGIHVMNADGTGVTPKLSDGREPSWSPDGSKIAFTSADNDIYVMNADGTGVKQLTTDPAQDTKPSWSPDGSKIAFTSGRVDDDTTTDTDIYVMNAADGSGVIRLTNDPANNLGANDVASSWSPDGSRVAFHSNRGFIPPEIYSMKADGTDLQRLTNNGVQDIEPSWSPDGSKIAFQTNRDGNLEIYSIKAADGTDIARLTNEPASDTDPDWGTHVPDTTPPTVVSVDPADGSTGVLINKVIKATFSEDVKGVDGNSFTVTDSTNTAVAGTVAYDSASKSASFTPSSNLNYQTTYTAKLTAAITDQAGNALVPTSWSFTTGPAPDTTPPTVTSTAPADGSTNIPVSTDVKATFSEPMDAATITTSTFTVAIEGTGSPISATVSYNPTDNTAKLIPSSPLEYSTKYKATVTQGVKDAAGNSMTADYSWSFTTGPAPDTTPPTVVNTKPADGSTNIPIGTAIDATFSEPMDSLTINENTFTVESSSGPVTGTVSYDSATKTAHFSTSSPLAYSTTYTAKIAKTVKDAAGNAMAADYSWTFTTEAAPNQPPTADLTANPTTINEGETSALDASGSTDPDSGDSLTYSFKILDNDPGTITDQTDEKDATATYNAPLDLSSDETVTIEVTVTDSSGATSTDSVQITVKNVPAKDATLTLSLDRSKVKASRTYTASGGLIDVAEETGLPGRTITIKTFDSSGNEITSVREETTTTQSGTYKVTMTPPNTPGKYTIQSFFDGDSDYKPAKSNTRTLTVLK